MPQSLPPWDSADTQTAIPHPPTPPPLPDTANRPSADTPGYKPAPGAPPPGYPACAAALPRSARPAALKSYIDRAPSEAAAPPPPASHHQTAPRTPGHSPPDSPSTHWHVSQNAFSSNRPPPADT